MITKIIEKFNHRKTIKLLIAACLCIFILNHFHSIYFRWHNHLGPIGIDDADYYISRIAFFKNGFSPNTKLYEDPCVKDSYYLQFFYGITSLAPLGKLASWLNITPEKMFYINFYCGILLMGLVLYLILKQFGTYPFNIIIGFLVFAFYAGNGAYHGFFWVTPSFYCIMAWLFVIWVFFFSKHWKYYAPFVIFLLLFSHPGSAYCIGITCFSLLLYGIIDKKLLDESIRKTVTLFSISIIYTIIYNILFAKGILGTLFFFNLPIISKIALLFKTGAYQVAQQTGKMPACLRNLNQVIEWINGVVSPTGAYGVAQQTSQASGEMPAYLRNLNQVIGGINGIVSPNGVKKITGNFRDFQILWNYTPFAAYFAGWLLPLVGGSLSFCVIRRQYKLLSLIISAFCGTIICSIILNAGVRTFLFLELIILFVVIYGIQENIIFLRDNRHEFSRWKQLLPGKRYLLLGSAILLLFSCLFPFYLIYKQISLDFTMRFRYQRFCRTKEMASFIKNISSEKKIFYVHENPWNIYALLDFESAWEKPVYSFHIGNILPAKLNLKYLDQFIVVGENRKIFKQSKEIESSKRYGFNIFWPSTFRIILKTGDLPPGKYQIDLTDTGISPEKFLDNIKLEVRKDGNFEKLSASWEKSPMDIDIPKSYPPLMFPWYSLAAKYIHKNKPKYLTIRGTFKYTMDFVLMEKTDSLYLSNDSGEELNFLGNIEIFSKSEEKSVFTLDFDWEKSEFIESKTGCSFQNKDYPLLWIYQNPNYRFYLDSCSDKFIPIPLELKGNFGDFKAFHVFKNKTYYKFYNCLPAK